MERKVIFNFLVKTVLSLSLEKKSLCLTLHKVGKPDIFKKETKVGYLTWNKGLKFFTVNDTEDFKEREMLNENVTKDFIRVNKVYSVNNPLSSVIVWTNDILTFLTKV